MIGLPVRIFHTGNDIVASSGRLQIAFDLILLDSSKAANLELYNKGYPYITVFKTVNDVISYFR